ncbi:MAG TPA: branched-chain amino acid ABC transporter permease [Solirubrobacteraceae bacterium]|nr:branched-chain amino acid ABC transporter permease [Solirubrobacteraceae bacterium]
MTRAVQLLGPAREWAPGVALLGFAALLPALASTEYVLLGAEMLPAVLLAVSFNLLFGYAGMFSFGQAAFYGVGAYATALLMNEAGFGFYLALAAGIVVATLLATLSGQALVRLEPIAFIMLTFALADLLEFAASHARRLTGGDGGTIAELPRSLNVDVAADGVYYAILAVTAVVLVAAFAYVRSRAGLMLRAIREDPLRAATLGIAVERRRLGVFALAGALAAAGGGLSVLTTQIVYPSLFAWQVSAAALIGTLLGGVGSFSGPMIGAVLLSLVNFYVGRSSTNTLLIDGGVLLAIVLVAPRGVLSLGSGSLPGALVGIGQRLCSRLKERRARTGATG